MDLSFGVADLEVQIDAATDAARAVWGGAPAPTAGARVRRFGVALGSPARVTCDGHPIVDIQDPRDTTSTLEGVLYQVLRHDLGARFALLHAAGVVVGDRTVVMSGRSGSGKSSLALAALADGAGYLSDELLVTDGTRVHGLGRAIQFDAVRADREPVLPAWLEDVERGQYFFRGEDGETLTVPLVPASSAERADMPLLASRAHVVDLVPSDRDELLPSEPVRALARLCEAMHEGGRLSVGDLVGVGRTWTLRWSDPAEAWALLHEALIRAE